MNPKLFNVAIMSMFAAAGAYWGYRYYCTGGRYELGQCCYWICSLLITATVTFVMPDGD